MSVFYRSTRGQGEQITASQAILNGIAPDGGLYVPTSIPVPSFPFEDFAKLDYRETALAVLTLFFEDFTEEELKNCVERAYDDKFDIPEKVALKEAAGVYYLELWHGPTIAFKDMALSILPHLMTAAARKNGITDEIVILTATSGDTGKAALAGFADVPGTRIAVFYPENGVSRIQKLQMVTQKGKNTCVTGIRGNFDDAQTGVKKMFTDRALAEELAGKGFRFSSANSINIGRLVPQIVYYIYAWSRLLKNGVITGDDRVRIAVPTGNFGNILAAYYAMLMGLPVEKLICASNENKVLYDFFGTGTYDRNREFVLTTSPSMDILISSNLERLIYHVAGDDPEKNRELMSALSSGGRYEITPKMKDRLAVFESGFATQEETAAEIKRVFDESGYLIDPHTAVASAVVNRSAGDAAPVILASTASPYKFAGTVTGALGIDTGDADDFALAKMLSEATNTEVPKAVKDLEGEPVRHEGVCDKDGMEQAVKSFLGV
ncbi:MAG: threonine synthase [Lachnospiraceae bacterium]|nr:threonine synthase [Lachnospiraceae bacterium]